MMSPRFNYWLMLIVGILAFSWLLFELMRALLEVIHRSGVSEIPFDGVMQHKVGELMVGAPLFIILLLLNKWPKERALTLVNGTRIIMIVGGLLNGLAWYSIRHREPWDSFFRIWCLVLLLAGILGAQIARWVINKSSERVVEG
ncbi:MAG: hypothetical protein JO360_14025 [Acidobacteria bacterium]|nr:hypothetical protein [Acidobacteriota bacterium]